MPRAVYADRRGPAAPLKSVHNFWNPAKNPSIRYTPVAKRVFHRDRNYAILLGLSCFSPVAVQDAKASALAPVALINGADFLDLLIPHGMGVVRSISGRLQLDPEFFQSLSAKVNAITQEISAGWWTASG